MKQLVKHSSIVSVEGFNDRVPTGIEGLDELIEEGLPRASMTILAGSPGACDEVPRNETISQA